MSAAVSVITRNGRSSSPMLRVNSVLFRADLNHWYKSVLHVTHFSRLRCLGKQKLVRGSVDVVDLSCTNRCCQELTSHPFKSLSATLQRRAHSMASLKPLSTPQAHNSAADSPFARHTPKAYSSS